MLKSLVTVVCVCLREPKLFYILHLAEYVCAPEKNKGLSPDFSFFPVVVDGGRPGGMALPEATPVTSRPPGLSLSAASMLSSSSGPGIAGESKGSLGTGSTAGAFPSDFSAGMLSRHFEDSTTSHSSEIELEMEVEPSASSICDGARLSSSPTNSEGVYDDPTFGPCFFFFWLFFPRRFRFLVAADSVEAGSLGSSSALKSSGEDSVA